MRWIRLARPDETSAPPVTVLATGVFVWVLGIPLLFFGVGNAYQAVASAVMFMLLLVVWLAWLTIHQCRRVSTASGMGLTIAAYAILMRVACEVHVWYFALVCTYLRVDTIDATLAVLVQLSRTGGVIGFVFGIALTVFATIAELRAPRATPHRHLPR
jgi:hypothetical protein